MFVPYVSCVHCVFSVHSVPYVLHIDHVTGVFFTFLFDLPPTKGASSVKFLSTCPFSTTGPIAFITGTPGDGD